MSKTKIGCTYNDSTVFEIVVNPTESELKLRPKVCKKTLRFVKGKRSVEIITK